MRNYMALALIAAGAIAGLAFAPGDAEAAKRGKSSRAAKVCDSDCVRANYLDPSGNYKAYPDWARAALSPKSDGPRR